MRVNGIALKALRERSGLSLRDLGELAGVGFKTIHDIERGQSRPTARTVEAIAAGLQIPLDAIAAPEFADQVRS